jgi:histidyl-tRNA synthetase
VDAELIALLHALLADLGVRDVQLRLASLGQPAARAAYRELLVAHLRANEDRLSEDVRARIDLNPLRAFDADHAGTREVMASAPLLVDHLSAEDADHFAEVRARLHAAGIEHEVDPTLVRGLDYYTRTVFECASGALGAQSAVGGGGRYDGLIEQLGGPPTPGMGWAAGVERMLLAAEPRPQPGAVCDLYVAGTGVAAFALAAEASSSSSRAARRRAG